MPSATADRETIRSFILGPNTFGTSLLAIALDQYGTEVFEWEAETLTGALKEDFGVELHRVNADKLFSLMVALSTNQFQTSAEIFSQTCMALNNIPVDFSTFTPPDTYTMAWGVAEVVLNDPPSQENGTSAFSDEVAGFAGMIMAEEGVWVAPKTLAFAEFSRSNPVLDLQTIYADDPDLVAAALANQQRNANDIEQFVSGRIKSLVAELASLPLQHRQQPSGVLTRR